jgi:hypothetical protein
MTTHQPLEHHDYCLPRPGESDPRIESYTHNITDHTGNRIVRVASLTRCVECGCMTVDGKAIAS